MALPGHPGETQTLAWAGGYTRTLPAWPRLVGGGFEGHSVQRKGPAVSKRQWESGWGGRKAVGGQKAVAGQKAQCPSELLRGQPASLH